MAADVDAAREALIEMVAEADEQLMEKFFDAGTLTDEQLVAGLKSATASGKIFPLLCTSSTVNIGIQPLLAAILAYLPPPTERPFKGLDKAGAETDRKADEKLLREEVRRAPVEVEIDPVTVLRAGVLEVVGKAGNAREFVSGCRIEISVAAAGVDRAMTDADVGKPQRIIVADRSITCNINHVVVDALVPAQRRGRYDISIGGQRILEYSGARRHNRSGYRRQRPCDTRGTSAEPTRNAYG